MKAPPFSSSALILLGFVSSAYADWKNLTTSNYKLKESGYSSVISALDAALPNVKVADILADTNHVNPSSSPGVTNLVSGTGYEWEDTTDFDDEHTDKWYPQGITTTADAYDKGDYDGHHAHIVSWHSDNYDNGKRGARVSFVNRDTPKQYRHVLLVRPTGTDDFEAIESLHAGGIMWYGTMLYVVSTTKGLLVFDLAHMYKVDGSSSDQIGKVSGGYAAYGYKYVLPQLRSYAWQSVSGVTDLRFSFMSLDRSTTPDSLLVGEYDASRTDLRVIRWDLDYQTRLLKTTSSIATASTAVQHGETKIQGATSVNGKYFLTQSGGSLITHTWADGQKKYGGVFPSVPEDLSYEKGKGIWSLMEAVGHRAVFAFDDTKF